MHYWRTGAASRSSSASVLTMRVLNCAVLGFLIALPGILTEGIKQQYCAEPRRHRQSGIHLRTSALPIVKLETRNQQRETGRTYKWWVVVMLWFVCFFNYADRQAIFSVFELLKSEMRLSDVQLGIVGASFMWVYAAVGPIAGLVGDRINRKALIIGGLGFWSVITIATAL